jgi:hypothetical protein
MADGYLGKCKECTKTDVSLNYQDNLQYYQEYDKIRGQLPHRKKAALDYLATPKGKVNKRIGAIKWVTKNPLKRSAQVVYGNWKRYNKDKIPTQCAQCGKCDGRLHAHHDDYSKPLDVRHLCVACHLEWHTVNGEGLNG